MTSRRFVIAGILKECKLHSSDNGAINSRWVMGQHRLTHDQHSIHCTLTVVPQATGMRRSVFCIMHMFEQVMCGLLRLAAALRVLRWPHLRYDCIYTRPQLYLPLLRLERSPYTDDGLYNVLCAVRCSSTNRGLRGTAKCLRTLDRSLIKTGFHESSLRNSCHLVTTTCAYLRVLTRFVRYSENLFANQGL